MATKENIEEDLFSGETMNVNKYSEKELNQYFTLATNDILNSRKTNTETTVGAYIKSQLFSNAVSAAAKNPFGGEGATLLKNIRNTARPGEGVTQNEDDFRKDFIALLKYAQRNPNSMVGSKIMKQLDKPLVEFYNARSGKEVSIENRETDKGFKAFKTNFNNILNKIMNSEVVDLPGADFSEVQSTTTTIPQEQETTTSRESLDSRDSLNSTSSQYSQYSTSRDSWQSTSSRDSRDSTSLDSAPPKKSSSPIMLLLKTIMPALFILLNFLLKTRAKSQQTHPTGNISQRFSNNLDTRVSSQMFRNSTKVHPTSTNNSDRKRDGPEFRQSSGHKPPDPKNGLKNPNKG